MQADKPSRGSQPPANQTAPDVPGAGTETAHEVLVIGAGQAGLAMGRELTRRGLDVEIVDGAELPGQPWRRRWDSLCLFTPARYSSLPGFAFPGPPRRLPGKNEVADYLAAYCDHFALAVRWDTPVHRLAASGPRPEHDGYVAHTPTGVIAARQVVLATGAFQRPQVPAAARGLDVRVWQVHAADYRNPDQLPAGPALVVGAGNSGMQLAAELSADRPVTLAVGSRHPYLPQRLAGRSVFWWLDRLGAMNISAHSRLGRRLRQGKEVLVGDTPRRLRRRGRVSLTQRVVAASGEALYAADGSVHHPCAVVWATGYVPDFSWVDLPVVGADGWVRQRGGRTDLPGLYTIGLPWQRRNGSALLGWVGRDAAELAAAIEHAARPDHLPAPRNAVARVGRPSAERRRPPH